MKENLTLKKILVVDDDPVSRELLEEVLRKEGYTVHLAESGEQALLDLDREDFPLVLSDVRMKEKTGFDLLRDIIKRPAPPSVVVLMTGFGSMEGAIDALRGGAFDYISKPFQIADLRSLVARARKHVEYLRESTITPPTVGKGAQAFGQSLIGRSPKIVEIYRTIARASLTSSSVLISGEAGTGKALVARSIHENGTRKGKPFLKISTREEIEALDMNLVQAAGGTILIEELVGLNASDQSRLLRMMERAELEALGLRWIATSRVSQGEVIKSNLVKSDLLDRLNIITMEIPPLRNRIDDLSELVSVFLAKFSEKNSRRVSHLTDSAMAKLKNYSWPGNIRELERVIERAVALSVGTVLEAEDFPDLGKTMLLVGSEPGASLETVEKAHIQRVLEETGFNKSRASEILGIDRATLYRKAKIYGIDLKGAGGSQK